MDDMRRGGGAAPTDDGVTPVVDWSELAGRLGALVAGFVAGDALLLELPPGIGGEGTPFVSLAAVEDGGVRAELPGDAVLASVYELDEETGEAMRLMGWRGNDGENLNWFAEATLVRAAGLAAAVVGALSGPYAVPHPQLLTFSAWGPSAEEAARLGLNPTKGVEDDEPAAPVVMRPNNRDDLVAMVRAVIQARVEGDLVIDEDGDIVLEHMGQPVWVMVRRDAPAFEVQALVAHGIRSRRAAAMELAVLNRDQALVEWVLRERSIFQRANVPAMPFVPEHLDQVVDLFLEVMSGTRDDLALRVGGRTA